MGMYIGFTNCPGCGIKYLTDPTRVIIWFSADSYEQVTEAVCSGCENIIQGKISFETMVAFRHHGCSIKQFSDRYEILTDQQIDDWDIEAELKEYDFSN